MSNCAKILFPLLPALCGFSFRDVPMVGSSTPAAAAGGTNAYVIIVPPMDITGPLPSGWAGYTNVTTVSYNYNSPSIYGTNSARFAVFDSGGYAGFYTNFLATPQTNVSG